MLPAEPPSASLTPGASWWRRLPRPELLLVAVVGLSTPTQMRPFIENGTVRDVILCNPIDLGCLWVYTAVAAATEGLSAGSTIDARRLGSFTVQEDELGLQVLLGQPFIFDASNIADFNF